MWGEIRERCQRQKAASFDMITLPVDQVLALEDELRGRWVPVDEQVPANREQVLVMVSLGSMWPPDITIGRFDPALMVWTNRLGLSLLGEVTHWRPVPK